MLNQDILGLESVYRRGHRSQPVVLPPKASVKRDILSEAILDEITKLRRGRPLDLAVSLMLHVAVVTVLEDAIIDERGNVIEVRAISGRALLVPAALKAVSQRKYEPTILDGELTPIELAVEVNFRG